MHSLRHSTHRKNASIRLTVGFVLAAVCLAGALGCKRGYYYRTADRDAYCLLNSRGKGPTWKVESSFNVNPDSRSRFYDPTCRTDPTLPVPAPRLYDYQLPLLATEAPKERSLDGSDESGINEPKYQDDIPTVPLDETSLSHSTASTAIGTLDKLNTIAAVPANEVVFSSANSNLAVVKSASPISSADLLLELDQEEANSVEPEQIPAPNAEPGEPLEIKINPIPVEAWLSLPQNCLGRMLEFGTVRDEYLRTFNRGVTDENLDPARRVSLENSLELALINNREYQSRKELLYRVALRLSLQQFAYQLKFFGTDGTDVGYVHDRDMGIEVNRLRTPSRLGLSRSLYTAGDLVARFANDVLLTFNGSSGYSSSVGSELLLELSQPLIQRDIRFESLTQAERDVVYAARDYVRFRKQLFSDLAGQYYSLLLTYRGIAIDTQDYFSNLRGFNRASALERVGQIPRFQVDQFEQNALRSRGNLISSCNTLERSLDRFKLQIGLPTEMPLNVDLSELEELTLRDEATVIQEQIRRKREYYVQQKERTSPQIAVAAAAELARRMVNLSDVRVQLGSGDDARQFALKVLVLRLELEDLRLEATKSRQKLSNREELELASIFDRTIDAATNSMLVIKKELDLLLALHAQRSAPSEDIPGGQKVPVDDQILRSRLSSLQQLVQEEVDLLERTLTAEKNSLYPLAIARLESVWQQSSRLETEVLLLLKRFGVEPALSDEDLDQLANLAVEFSQDSDFVSFEGLAAVEVDMDEAMLTALVQRLDLMNQRGELADAWRDIKYAGDALKSVLNVEASQSIRTRPGGNNPFDFSFDDSTTNLGLQFDTPLNRRGERNTFRLALINYNAALRNVIGAQDNVKLDIRDDLRSLELDRNQYDIAIASAALAYERVVSTRMQLIMPGGRNVSARDFLEAQQAYTQSLSSVARQHIGYLADRIQFFLDLEQLQVDAVNFWPDLRNESYPFLPNTDFGSTTPDGYGTLPCGPWYSDCLRRMEQVPAGDAN